MFTLCLLKWLVGAMMLIAPNFLFLSTDFICNGENGSWDCQEWVCSYNDQGIWRKHMGSVPKSLTYEFEWYVCSKKWVVPLVQSMLYLGTVIGYMTVPYFADNFGRRRVERIVWGIATVGILLISTSMTIVTVGIGLFLFGTGIPTAMSLHYCFLNELVIGKTRSRMVMWLQLTYSMGIFLIALLAMMIPNWRMFSIFCLALPIIILNFGCRYLEETPEFSYKKSP